MTMIREFLKGCALVLGGRRARRTVAGADAWRVVSAGQKVLLAFAPSRQATDAATIRLNLAIAQARQELAA